MRFLLLLLFLVFLLTQIDLLSSRKGLWASPLLYAAIALLVGFVLGYWQRRVVNDRNVKSFQNHGEALLANTLRKHFNTDDYHLLNHITLKQGDGTTQIDHILVSRFGLFVIETKDYTGWIFANADHATWTQATFNNKYKFQNPIHQNYRHVLAVKELLDFLPSTAIHSVVVFVGDADFKTDIPAGVFTLPKLIEYLRSCTEEVLSINRMQFCVGRLETARLSISHKTDLAHIEDLQRRYGARL
jgi:cytochrome c-type biogenesis protein CcmH/NrfF